MQLFKASGIFEGWSDRFRTTSAKYCALEASQSERHKTVDQIVGEKKAIDRVKAKNWAWKADNEGELHGSQKVLCTNVKRFRNLPNHNFDKFRVCIRARSLSYFQAHIFCFNSDWKKIEIFFKFCPDFVFSSIFWIIIIYMAGLACSAHKGESLCQNFGLNCRFYHKSMIGRCVSQQLSQVIPSTPLLRKRVGFCQFFFHPSLGENFPSPIFGGIFHPTATVAKWWSGRFCVVK